MRQLLIQVPRGCGKTVLDIAKDCNGTNLAQLEATGSDEPLDVVIVHVSNSKVEELLEKLQKLPNLQVTIIPRGVVALHPPPSETPQQVTNVEVRSPIEVFISGLQSVGSWKGFLGYAATAGVVVWIGLFTNTSYLLVAAMLLAPFASPAMNTAIATARGDKQLLKQSSIRYFAALGVTIAVTCLLSLIFQQKVATSLMVETIQVSSVAVLLPLAAGAAGALNLMQSERSSLVSGAAIGMLVAASLAPPAGIVGMAIALGRWEMAIDGLFLLLLQLAGINFSAAILFRIYGLNTKGTRYDRGKKSVSRSVALVTLLALASLLTWQFSSSPHLQRSSRAQRATAQIQNVLKSINFADLVEANVRFTRPDIRGQNTLLSEVYVQRRRGVNLSDAQIRSRITNAIQRQLLAEGFNVTPLVSVTVLEAPSIPPKS